MEPMYDVSREWTVKDEDKDKKHAREYKRNQREEWQMVDKRD